MDTRLMDISLTINAPGYERNELDSLTKSLKNEITELDVTLIDPDNGKPVPEGALGAEWIKIGGIMIKLSAVVIPAFIAIVKAWVDRTDKKTTKKEQISLKIKYKDFEFELEKTTSAQEIKTTQKALQDKITSPDKNV